MGESTWSRGRRWLHIQIGDCSAGMLRQSGIPGEILVWHDPVMEGRLIPDSNTDAYRRMRAEHFTAQQYAKSVEEATAGLAARHATAAHLDEVDEVVLWFDACLFDQTSMVYIIDFLSRVPCGDTQVSLLCIGEHPNFDRFRGLGELDPLQTATLFPQRRPLTNKQVDLARHAWQALASDDPRTIEALAREPHDCLPYLQEAMRRRLEQFPSVENGLNRLEQEALMCIADGCEQLMPLFGAVSDMEPPPFFGDIMLWRTAADLADGEQPLVDLTGPGPLVRPLWDPVEDLSAWRVGITDTGRDVLAGQQDWPALRPMDRWSGGVHLQGRDPVWRWSRDEERLMTRP